jgi:DNA-binding transcriptional regulator YiaG
MTIKCECGGTLREATLKEFDFSAFAGFPVLLRDVPGLRCSKCKRGTIPGDLINDVLHQLAVEITKLPQRLMPQHARFLRKHLRLSQKELAKKMGIVRETVAKWECGDAQISPQQDFVLRAIAIAHLMKVAPQPPKPSDVVSAISGVRRGAIESDDAMPSPLIINEFLSAHRSKSSVIV